MNHYEREALRELVAWRESIRRPPSLLNRGATGVQKRIEKWIPERLHRVVTSAIEQITRAVLYGSSSFIGGRKVASHDLPLEAIESEVRRRIRYYALTAATEGALTGAGGFLWGLADFPLWLALKMRLLFEIAATYGHDTEDLRERIHLLHVFRLTFSSQAERAQVIETLESWPEREDSLPADISDFDWRSFQLEYRNTIDLAKLAQLVPGFGAVAGFYVNRKYTKRLGHDAMQAYRLRRFHRQMESMPE